MRAIATALVSAFGLGVPVGVFAADQAAGARSVAFCGQTLAANERYVHCHDPHVADLTPLRELRALETLDLDGTGVHSLEPLVGRSSLRNVKIRNTPIADLGPLRSHRYIEFLHIDKTKVGDLEPLADHQALAELSLDDTKVASLVPVLGLPKLRKLEFERTPALTEAAIRQLARHKAIHMTTNQVRRLALYRLLAAKPAGLQVTRHPNGNVKTVGLLREGRKQGWWATFDQRGDLIEEHDYWQGKVSEGVRNWTYNRYNCVENTPRDIFFLGHCLPDELTLDRAERLAVLAHAERLLSEHREEVAKELLSAALVDDPEVRRGVAGLLVKARALDPRSARLLPSRERLARHLQTLARPLGQDFAGLQPENCGIGAGPPAALLVSCTRFVGCAGACRERHASLELVITSAGARLSRHDIHHGDRGRCGYCMHDF